MVSKGERIVFLDYLRFAACFMVMVIHSCEPFYLGGEGMLVAGRGDALCVTAVECICRVCVPLFVMASGYLLFPVVQPTGVFFRRRFARVAVPFFVWSAAYIWFSGGSWGKALFNFPDEGGHLWFVPMLLGVYLLMPLFSPWAEKVSRSELRGWLALWLVTTTFPYLRRLWGALYGEPAFGAVPYLYGECPWNMFGAFHYVSGFAGYMLLGFYFRKFAEVREWRRTLGAAVPLMAVGMAIIGCGFYFRIPGFPYRAEYAMAVDLEMSIEYCSLGVVLATAGAFMVLRKFTAQGALYRCVVRPAAEASYGAYLMHMFMLPAVLEAIRPHCATPVAILATAAITFALASIAGRAIGKIPVIGRWLVG